MNQDDFDRRLSGVHLEAIAAWVMANEPTSQPGAASFDIRRFVRQRCASSAAAGEVSGLMLCTRAVLQSGAVFKGSTGDTVELNRSGSWKNFHFVTWALRHLGESPEPAMIELLVDNGIDAQLAGNLAGATVQSGEQIIDEQDTQHVAVLAGNGEPDLATRWSSTEHQKWLQRRVRRQEMIEEASAFYRKNDPDGLAAYLATTEETLPPWLEPGMDRYEPLAADGVITELGPDHEAGSVASTVRDGCRDAVRAMRAEELIDPLGQAATNAPELCGLVFRAADEIGDDAEAVMLASRSGLAPEAVAVVDAWVQRTDRTEDLAGHVAIGVRCGFHFAKSWQ